MVRLARSRTQEGGALLSEIKMEMHCVVAMAK
jgi:hypothetical protein